jgi:hypothetical protein
VYQQLWLFVLRAIARMSILHQSSKLYWKQKCTLDLLIVEHETFDVFELRAYEPTINKESVPVFIDRGLVLDVIPEQDIAAHVRALKEPILRRKEIPDEASIAKQARNDTIAEFIVNRIHIQDYSIENNMLDIAVVNTVMDTERGRPSLGCARPPGLVPYNQWTHATQNRYHSFD